MQPQVAIRSFSIFTTKLLHLYLQFTSTGCKYILQVYINHLSPLPATTLEHTHTFDICSHMCVRPFQHSFQHNTQHVDTVNNINTTTNKLVPQQQ